MCIYLPIHQVLCAKMQWFTNIHYVLVTGSCFISLHRTILHLRDIIFTRTSYKSRCLYCIWDRHALYINTIRASRKGWLRGCSPWKRYPISISCNRSGSLQIRALKHMHCIKRMCINQSKGWLAQSYIVGWGTSYSCYQLGHEFPYPRPPRWT
jgi:hypothetical protein